MEIIPIPGGTNVSAGYLKSGSSSGASPPTSGPFGTATVTVAAGAVLDVNGQTVGNAINLSGTGISSNGAIINSSTTAATISADITLAAHSSVGGSNAVTLSGAISGGYNFTKVGSSTYTLSGTNTYTGDTTITTGTLKLIGRLDTATDLIIGSNGTLDLQATQTFATLDLDGAISNTAGTSSLVISGAASMQGTAATTGTQTYSGAVTLTDTTTITTSSAKVTFAAAATINSQEGETNNLTINASEVEFNGAMGGIGVIDINANLDLDAAITNATSIDVSGTSNLGANVTTSGTQTYTGAVTLSAATVTLTTTNSDVTFGGTIDSDAGQTRNLTINTGGTTGTIQFGGLVGDTVGLGAISITGNLDLDANIVDAASLAVSGASNLGANVTTSGTQTYTGDITLSADVGLNTLGGNVQIDGDVNTALVSGGSESGIIQFLGSGSYKYSTDSGSTYSTGTASGSSTTLGTGSLTYSSGSYSWTTPDNVTSTKLLVVAGGGGGGGSFAGAGGGAGGYVYNTAYSVTENTAYSVTIGSGGTGGTYGVVGSNGTSSFFGAVEAYGGGGGGSYSGGSTPPPACPTNGCGSSGGTGWNVSNAYIRTASQGNAGTGYQAGVNNCTGNNCSGNSGGAGGGAGGAGQLNASAVLLSTNANVPSGYYSTSPTGGVGLANSITGTSTYYAGGGGSGSDGLGGNGGLGGGGNGGSGASAPSGYQYTDGLDGSANTGGGGGGGGGNSQTPTGGDGGSGIVVVNYSYNAATYAEYDLSINTGAGDIDINSNLANLGELNLTSTSAGSEISGIISTDTIVNKAGSGTLTLSGNNTFTGDTTITTGTLTVTGTLADTTDVSVASGAVYDVDQTDTIQSLSGAGTINIASTKTLTFGDATNDKTISGAIEGAGSIEKTGSGTLTLSATNTYTGDTTISAGTLKLTGNLNSATDLVIDTGATLDLQAALTAATLTLNGTISNTANTSSLTISGTSNLGGDVTTTGTQTYQGAVTLSAATVTLTTTDSNITFNGTIDSDGVSARALTINLDGNSDGTTADVIFGNATADTLGATNPLGAISITGDLDLNAAITSAASLSVSGTSNLGANVTTSGTQTYTGAVTLSAATVTLTTTNSDVTFGGTIDSDAGQTRNLTINTGGTTGTIQFGGLVGDTVGLGAISITGNLDLDANIVDAASLAVSGASNLGANVTTSGSQTYTGAVTLSAATVTLTTTNNGDISFNNVVDGDYNLQVNTHGTGDTTFAQAVGANTALNNITITTDEFTAAAIKADGTFSLTNLTASTISGILSETSALALTKAGVGNLTLSAVNTFTGDTTISAGDVVDWWFRVNWVVVATVVPSRLLVVQPSASPHPSAKPSPV